MLKLPNIAILLRTFRDKKLKIIFRMAQTKYGGNVVSDHNLTDCSTPAELQIDAWCVQTSSPGSHFSSPSLQGMEKRERLGMSMGEDLRTNISNTTSATNGC